MNKFRGIWILMIGAILLNACSFTKLIKGKKQNVYVWKNEAGDSAVKAVVPVLTDTVSVSKTVPVATTASELVARAQPIWNHRLSYKTFSGKAKVHISSPDDKEEFTAHIRLRKDSVIWMNITALGGILFAKVFINRDSFYFINYIQKTYMGIPLSSAAKILPTKVDFNSLQNLVTGEPLRGGDVIKAEFDADTAWITTMDTGYVQELQYLKTDSTLRGCRITTRRPDGPQALGDYGVYLQIGERKVSSNRSLVIHNGTEEYELDLNFAKIDFDEPLEYRFSIPESFSRKE